MTWLFNMFKRIGFTGSMRYEGKNRDGRPICGTCHFHDGNPARKLDEVKTWMPETKFDSDYKVTFDKADNKV